MRNLCLAFLVSTLLSTQLTTASEKTIETELRKLDSNIPISSIEPSAMDGMYIVKLQDGEILYANADANYLFRGDMLELKSGSLNNLTAEIRDQLSVDRFESIGVENMIVFSPAGKTKKILYVFTDVDCGFCRKLHQEVAAMNAIGIEIRYLAFPRGGQRSPAYSKMVDAWCAPEPSRAITRLVSGRAINKAADNKQRGACASVVDEQYEIGVQLGVTGTPTVFIDSQMIPGYRTASQFARLMGF